MNVVLECRRFRRFVLSIAALWLAVQQGSAQCPSLTSWGHDFILTFPRLYEKSDDFTGTIVVMSEEQAQVEVTIPSCTPSQYTLSVGPSSPATVPVCSDAQFIGQGVPDVNYDIRVTRVDSPAPTLQVVFKSHKVGNFVEEAFLVLPISRLGNSYWSLGYRGGSSDSRNGSRWAVVTPNALTLSYQDCAGNTFGQGLSADDVFQIKCQDSDRHCHPGRGPASRYRPTAGTSPSSRGRRTPTSTRVTSPARA